MASIITVFFSAWSAASTAIIRADTALSLHCFEPWQNVLCWPRAAGASSHRKPLRLMKIKPDGTRSYPHVACRKASERTVPDTSSARRSARKIRDVHRSFSNRKSQYYLEINVTRPESKRRAVLSNVYSHVNIRRTLSFETIFALSKPQTNTHAFHLRFFGGLWRCFRLSKILAANREFLQANICIKM